MSGLLQRQVRRWLKVPPDPQPPEGSARSVRVFHAAPGYFRYALARWSLRQVGVVIGVVFALLLGRQFLDWMSIESEAVTHILREVPRPIVALAEWLRVIDIEGVPDAPKSTRISVGAGLFWLECLGLLLVALQLPLSYAMMRLDYELRFYIVTDRSLRIREGITAVRESTMTFDNIQNVSIHQGPVQRLFGIADLRVRTAGGGAGAGEGGSDDNGAKRDSMHVGYFRGIDNAEAVRDTILGRLRSLRGSGIGGPDEPHRPGPGDDAANPLRAARSVLDAARALREFLTS